VAIKTFLTLRSWRCYKTKTPRYKRRLVRFHGRFILDFFNLF